MALFRVVGSERLPRLDSARSQVHFTPQSYKLQYSINNHPAPGLQPGKDRVYCIQALFAVFDAVVTVVSYNNRRWLVSPISISLSS